MAVDTSCCQIINRAVGELGYELADGPVHSLDDSLPHSRVTGRFHGRRLGSLAYGSNRTVNFPTPLERRQ
jgi:hypothetical protein